MKIYELIRQVRKEKEMTQQELADKVHLTVQAVNQYEAGKREIKAEMLVSLLKALGYDFSIQETFVDREIYALLWDLSYYYEYINEHGMCCSCFQGAVELSKEEYDELVLLIKTHDFQQASEKLYELTKDKPGPMDAWPAFSWEEFFEQTTLHLSDDSVLVKMEEETNEDDWDQYMTGSFLSLKPCLMSDIKDKTCMFDRNVFY